MFEDSSAGIQAGLSAGMRTVALPDARFTKVVFPHADVVLKGGLEEFDMAYLLE